MKGPLLDRHPSAVLHCADGYRFNYHEVGGECPQLHPQDCAGACVVCHHHPKEGCIPSGGQAGLQSWAGHYGAIDEEGFC